MPSDSSDILTSWYAGPYREVSASANGSSFEKYMHRALEAPIPITQMFRRVLEVGGHQGEHIPYVGHGFDEYVLTDLHLPETLPELAADSRIKVAACDAADLPYADASFDRAVMTCVMHHVDSPLNAASELRRVVRPGGCISVLVPTDPGLAYRCGKEFASGRLARRKGLHSTMTLVNAIAHHNHFRSIRRQLEHVFEADQVTVRWDPFGLPSMNLNAFTVWTVRRVADA